MPDMSRPALEEKIQSLVKICRPKFGKDQQFYALNDHEIPEELRQTYAAKPKTRMPHAKLLSQNAPRYCEYNMVPSETRAESRDRKN